MIYTPNKGNTILKYRKPIKHVKKNNVEQFQPVYCDNKLQRHNEDKRWHPLQIREPLKGLKKFDTRSIFKNLYN